MKMSMETLQRNGYLVGSSDSLDTYSYNGDKYLCYKDNGNVKVVVIGGYYRK